MPVRRVFLSLVAAGLLGGFSGVAADTLLIENVRGADSRGSERPRTGQTMDQVEDRFGAPSERVAAVGRPPISRWVYDRFTVYFEDDRVLHAVVRRD